MHRRWMPYLAAGLTIIIITTSLPAATEFVSSQGQHPTEPNQLSDRSGCYDADPATDKLYSRREISPASILSCDRATMTVTLSARCPVAPMHVVISVDRSASMASGNALEEAKRGARDVLSELESSHEGDTQVGLVTHGQTATRDLELTDSIGRVRARLSAISLTSNDDLAGSIKQSTNMLIGSGRMYDNPPRRMIVVFTDGAIHDALGATAAARDAKRHGIMIYVVCIANGRGDCSLLRALAWQPTFSFIATSTGGLRGRFRDIAERLRTIHFEQMNFRQTMPVGVSVVDRSWGNTRGVTWEPQERRLSWSVRGLPRTRVTTRTLRVELVAEELRQRAGALPVTMTFSSDPAWYWDSANRSGVVRVPTATLNVSGLCPEQITPPVPATPTDLPPPTAPATPSSAPHWTPPAQPSPYFTPIAPVATSPIEQRIHRAFLPISQLERCIERQYAADVVLLIDVSSSMSGATVAGRTKIEAAKDGARAFVNNMRRGDRTAIVAFDAQAYRLAPLMGISDRAKLYHAIEAIVPGNGTRIDLALRAGHEILAGHNRFARRPAMVLMTDGRVDQQQAADAEAIATEFQLRLDPDRLPGRLFTIAVGSDADDALLRRLAGADADDDHHSIEHAEELARTLVYISQLIPCAGNIFVDP